jgi:hypothetical protein
VLTQFLTGRTATMTVIVDRAVQRGEAPAGTDSAEIIRTVTALSATGCLSPASSPCEALADSVAAAARAGAGQSAQSA